MTKGHYQVVYLTGAPASGKSTLLRALAESITPLLPFSYSKALAERVSGQGSDLAEADLRARSSAIVSPQDVVAVDSALLDMLASRRGEAHIVIDSHAVTKEAYGFRVTPFRKETLQAISPTIIACLYTPAEATIARIEHHPQGRPLPSVFEANLHTDLQCTVALIYAIELGIPVYFLDSTKPTEVLVGEIRGRIAKGA